MNSENGLFLEKYGKEIFIVMPAFNEAQTIEKVMGELIPKGLQLVVVDDGSNDKTYSIVKKVEKKRKERNFQ